MLYAVGEQSQGKGEYAVTISVPRPMMWCMTDALRRDAVRLRRDEGAELRPPTNHRAAMGSNSRGRGYSSLRPQASGTRFAGPV